MRRFLFLTAVALFFTSCRKVYEYIHDHPGAQEVPCKPTQLRFNGYYSHQPDTVDITYNDKGDPTDMVQRAQIYSASENTDRHWRYDRSGRLTLYFINFSLPPGAGPLIGALFWHKYGYPRKNFVTDTLIQYAQGFPPNYKDWGGTITGYGLDEKGKIIKVYSVSDDPHQPPQLVQEMTYDAHGNLPLPPDTTLAYDDQVNIFRTSYFFQFVQNDFSRNNMIEAGITPIHAFAYNEFGLPVVVPKWGLYYGYPFGLVSSGPVTYIDYACAAPRGPVNY